MSQIEFHTGTARKVKFSEGLSLQEKVDELKLRGFIFEYEDVESNDLHCDELAYMYNSGDFYQLLKHTRLDEDQDISIASKNPDGTIDFTLQFYNGGCGFEEAFEEAVDKVEKEV